MMFHRILSLFLLLGAASCQLISEIQNPGPSPDNTELLEELKEKRDMWEAQDAECYDMTITRQCFCVRESRGPFDLVVKQGEVSSVTPDNEFSDDLPTVEGLFVLIEEAAVGIVAQLTVSYDPDLGYPTDVYIDRDQRIADEEIGYKVEVTDIRRCRIGKPVHPVKPFRPIFPSHPRFPVHPGRPNRRLHPRRRKFLPKGNFPIQPTNSECKASLIASTIGYKDIVSTPTDSGFQPDQFLPNLHKWAEYLESVQCEYKYKLTRACRCTHGFVGPFIITVAKGNIVDAVLENGDPVPNNILNDLPTISDLFKVILDEAKEADKVEIEYDSGTGVPTKAFFDRIASAIDDEITYFAELH